MENFNRKQPFFPPSPFMRAGSIGPYLTQSKKSGAFSIIHNSRVLRVAAAAALSEWRHSGEPYTKIEERVSVCALGRQVSAVNHNSELNTPVEKNKISQA